MPKPIHTACIIDDDPTYVFLTKRIITMKRLCERVLIYENGRIGIEELSRNMYSRDELPDVILLDINMPEMDGWQFLEEFIKIKPKLSKKVTVYMVSSSIDQADIERAKQYEEVSSYVIKPVSIKMLCELFESIEAENSADHQA